MSIFKSPEVKTLQEKTKESKPSASAEKKDDSEEKVAGVKKTEVPIRIERPTDNESTNEAKKDTQEPKLEEGPKVEHEEPKTKPQPQVEELKLPAPEVKKLEPDVAKTEPEAAKPTQKVVEPEKTVPSEPVKENLPENPKPEPTPVKETPVATSQTTRKKVRREEEAPLPSFTESPTEATFQSEIKEEYEAKEVRQSQPNPSESAQAPVKPPSPAEDEKPAASKPEPQASEEEKRAIQESLQSGPVVWLFTVLNYWQLIVGIIIGFVLCRIVSR